MNKLGQLHCGACMTNFDDMDELQKHIETCPAAKVILPLFYKVVNGGDGVGHPLSHFVQCLHRNANIIKRYAYAVADGVDNLQRSKLHSELCDKLDFDYNKFKPFESSTIRKFPTRRKAEVILWEAISEMVKTVEDKAIYLK